MRDLLFPSKLQYKLPGEHISSITAQYGNKWRYSTNTIWYSPKQISWSKIRSPSHTRRVYVVGTCNITDCSLTLRLARVQYWGHSTQLCEVCKSLQYTSAKSMTNFINLSGMLFGVTAGGLARLRIGNAVKPGFTILLYAVM